MITFEQFLTLISPDKVEKAKKFEQDFYTMFRPGTLSVCTIGFIVSFPSDEPESFSSEDAQYRDELISLFNPLHAWIGTATNREEFKKKYPQITVEAYSFFENDGFIPVAVIPISMVKLLDKKEKEVI